MCIPPNRETAGHFIAVGRVSHIIFSFTRVVDMTPYRWIGELEAKHVNIDEGLGAKLSWDVSRGRDFQNIAHMIYCCDGYPDEQLLPTAQKIEKWISREDKPTAQFKEDIENVLRGLWVIATTQDLKSGFVDIPQRVAPVEFIFIGACLTTFP